MRANQPNANMHRANLRGGGDGGRGDGGGEGIIWIRTTEIAAMKIATVKSTRVYFITLT